MGLWDTISNIPSNVADTLIQTYNEQIILFIEPMLTIAKVMITANIDPYNFQGFWQVIISIISYTYLLLFLIVGLKFLFGSYDAVQRAEAKEWFKKAVLIIIFVNASLLIYSLVLGLSSGIATYLWDTQFEGLFQIQNLSSVDFFWLNILAIAIFLAVLTLVARQIFLIAAVMLFPLGLFLFFIPPVKPYGSITLNLIGTFAFMNVLDVIILCGVQLFWAEFDSLQAIGLLAPTIGFLFIFIANIAVMAIAIKKALSAPLIGMPVSKIMNAGVATLITK
jgi:hypothetical protein